MFFRRFSPSQIIGLLLACLLLLSKPITEARDIGSKWSETLDMDSKLSSDYSRIFLCSGIGATRVDGKKPFFNSTHVSSISISDDSFFVMLKSDQAAVFDIYKEVEISIFDSSTASSIFYKLTPSYDKTIHISLSSVVDEKSGNIEFVYPQNTKTPIAFGHGSSVSRTILDEIDDSAKACTNKKIIFYRKQ